MAFWSDYALGVPDPKRKYRFLVFAGGIAPWVAKSVSKPGWEVSQTEHTYLVHKFYYPGKVTWKDVTMTLVDPSGNGTDTMQTIYNNLKEGGYAPPETDNNYTTISKNASVAALGNLRIQQIADDIPSTASPAGEPLSLPSPKVVEEWMLYGAWIKDVDLGELSYDTDELSELKLTLRYDYAKLNTDNQAATTGVPGRNAGFPQAQPLTLF